LTLLCGVSLDELSGREIPVTGDSGAMILRKMTAGEQLTVSPRTVDAHLRNLFAKLGITSRAALSEALRQRDSA
jgi:ATP/maltotriose-dependent transcriptional regulator MalT